MPLTDVARRSSMFCLLASFLFALPAVFSVPAAFAQDTVPSPMIVSPMGQGFAPLNPLVVNPATREPSAYALNPDFGNLPDAPGMEDTYYSCTACHSTATFSAQRLTDARWEYLWDWMITDQGMADYGDEAREVILAYLQTHFSSQR